MNLFRSILLLISCSLFASDGAKSVETQLLEEEPCRRSNTVFSPGEELVYKLYYNWGFVWIAAGEVVFRVDEHANQYHISAAGRTYKSYDWFFKVRDYYDSYIDKHTLLPRRTIRKVEEGNYRLYDDVTYEHGRGVAISNKGKTEEDLDREEISLMSCTHDVLSAIYMMRNVNFTSDTEGGHLPMQIYIDRKIYNLDVLYAGKDDGKRIKGLGQCGTLLFRPQVVVGTIFKDNDGMKVYVSDDQNKIPLMIESPISVGSVKAVLESHSGLKYPAKY